MKVCLVILGTDVEAAAAAAEHVAEGVIRKGTYISGPLPIMIMSPDGMDMVLKHGAPLPHYYTNAEARLLFGIDGESTAYLDRVGEELEKIYLGRASTDGMPEILRMSKVVADDCKRRHLKRIWVQDVSPDATEQDIERRLYEPGLEMKHVFMPQLEVDVWEIQTRIIRAETQAQKTELVNEIRKRLSFMAQQAGFQAVVMDRLAWPFLEAKELTSEWGPVVIDGFGLYLEAATDWVVKNVQDDFAPPPPAH